MSDAPQHREIETILRDIGRIIGTTLEGKGYGFALFIYEYGPGGAMFYIANAPREDLTAALQEFINKQLSPLKPGN